MLQKRIYLSPPHMGSGEMEYIKDAFQKNWITTSGENLNRFEEALRQKVSIAHAVALNSGTAAIHMALILLGIKQGDEVICPTFTFVATANPILQLGAVPIFVDSEKETWNISPFLLEETVRDRIKKGKKPKAIIVVHLYGRPAKMNEILSIAEKYEIPVLEDAAESLGSTYFGKMTGTIGVLGVYSFNGNKIITTSGGGILVSDKKEYIDKALYLSTQARDKAPYYQHSEQGFNYRMSNILAGIGIGQLELLDERVKQKRKIYKFYEEKLTPSGNYQFVSELENTFENKWLTTVLLKEQKPIDVKNKLESFNVESRLLWKPLHLQPLFKDVPSHVDGTSEQLFENGLCLPSGTAMTQAEMEFIVSCL